MLKVNYKLKIQRYQIYGEIVKNINFSNVLF